MNYSDLSSTDKKIRNNDEGVVLQHDRKLDELASQASTEQSFISIVQDTASKLEAIANVRVALGKLFPEIKKLADRSEVMGTSVASNELIIAKRIVALLSKEWSSTEDEDGT